MISIKDVTPENVFDICELTTNKNGIGTTMEEYLCCNGTSIAESKYYPEMHPKAIYEDDVLIGFVMYKKTEQNPHVATICRFMIDYKYQGKGLGKKSLAAILDYLRESGITKAVIMVLEENLIAKRLYTSLGFRFNGTVDKDEHYYERDI